MINDKPTYQELEYQILQLRQQISESTAEKQNLTLQYQIAFEASNDMIAIVDTDYKYTMVNETFLKQRNCTREDIINHPVEKILGKEPFQIIKQNLDKCFKGQIIQYEIQINYPSKGLRNIEVKYLPYKNKNNMVDHVVSVMSDITERKKTEREIIAAKEKAEESEKRYKMMINAAMFPIVISSFDGKVVFINQAASDFFGVSFNEIDQLSSPDFWANSPQRTEFVSQLKENGDVNNIEIDYKTINHGVRRTIMSSTIIDYNENKAILSILYDVTEQKNAERALQKSEEKYRYIVDNAPIGIVQRSMQGSFNFCNLTVAKQFECNSIDEFLLNYDDITKRWNNPEQFIEFNKLLLKNGEVLGFENEVKLVNGKTKWFALYYKIDTTRSILDGFSLDITERKWAEEVLRQNEALLNALLSSMKDIIFEIDLNGCFEGYFAQENKSLYAQPDFFIGKKFEEVLPEDVCVLLRQAIESINSGSPYQQFEYHLTVNNIIQWEHAVITPRYSKSNELVGVTVVCRNITERKKAEEALLKSEKRYAFIAKNTADVIWTQNFDTGKFTYVSSSVHKLRGYTPDEVMNQTMGEALTPESLQKTSALIQEGLAKRKSGDTSSFTSIVLVDQPCKDGSVVSTEAVVTLVFDEKGAPVEIIGVTRDITERKNAEAILTKLFTAINYTKASIVITDIEGNIEFANPYFTQLTGYTKEEFTGANPKVLKSGIHTDEFYKEMWDTIKSGNTWEGEFCNRKKNDELYWEKSIITPIKNEKEEISNFVAVKSDITNEKKHKYLNDISLEIYEKSENFSIEGILKHSIELGILLTNSEIGFFHFVNDDQETISLQAWSAKTMDICNVPTLDKHYPISKAGVWVDCLYQKKPVYHNDYSSLSHKKGLPEGHATIIRDLSVPVIIENKVVAIFGVGNKVLDYDKTDAEFLSIFAENVWNVIRRKNAELDTIKAKEKAEESDLLKSTFLQNMSHEVRTPLNAIAGFSQLMTEPNQSPENLKKFSEMIINSSYKLIEIITDVIKMSQIHANQAKIKLTEIELVSFIANVVKSFTDKANEKNLNLLQKVNIPDKEYAIYSDSEKLKSIFSHLIDNAIKFTSQGTIEITCELTINNIQFTIKDTGIGISEEMQQIIFEPFRQVETGMCRKFGGNGLGLAISKAYTELLNGSLSLKSEINKGTTFIISIPIKRKKTERND